MTFLHSWYNIIHEVVLKTTCCVICSFYIVRITLMYSFETAADNKVYTVLGLGYMLKAAGTYQSAQSKNAAGGFCYITRLQTDTTRSIN